MKVKFLDLKDFDESFKYSGLEVVDDRFYFISSNGEEVLLTNNKWNTEDKFSTTQNSGLAHPVQTGNSATVIIRDGKNPAFLLFGTGVDEAANWALKINLKSRLTQEIDLSEFYTRVADLGIEHLHIQSATLVNDKIVFLNRPNEIEQGGHLIVADANFYKKQSTADVRIARLQWESESENLIKISAVYYSYQNDWLIVTGNSAVSSGNNESGLTQEVILGVVENAYRKIDRKRIKVNELFNLRKADESFKNQTIKSIAIQDDKLNKIKLHMIGAAEDGTTSLMKLRLKTS